MIERGLRERIFRLLLLADSHRLIVNYCTGDLCDKKFRNDLYDSVRFAKWCKIK